MLTRHLSRELVLQTLFNLDSRYDIKKITGDSAAETLNDILDSLHDIKIKSEDEFILKLLNGTLKELDKIDDILNKATPDWGVEKTAIVDRNILRTAIYEMLFANGDVPPRVVINEAIELGKTFGHRKSYKFISGVLGTVYDIAGLKVVDEKERSKKKLIEKKKIGAMAYHIKNGKPMVLMVHNIFNKWTLPKGDYDKSLMDESEALKNILKEKINAEGGIAEIIGQNQYRAGENKSEVTQKSIAYYLFEVSNPTSVKLNQSRKGLNNLRWFNLRDFQKLDKYDDMEKVLNNGLKILSKNIK